MKKYFIYIGLILAVNLPLLSHAKDIADRLIAQYVQQYEALEKFNDENDRHGRPDLNNYVIEVNPNWIDEKSKKKYTQSHDSMQELMRRGVDSKTWKFKLPY